MINIGERESLIILSACGVKSILTKSKKKKKRFKETRKNFFLDQDAESELIIQAICGPISQWTNDIFM